MNASTPELESLKRSFLAREGGAPEGCPEVERIWWAAHGNLPVREIHDLVAHTSGCPACAAAWRLARDAQGEEIPAGTAVILPRWWMTSRRAWLPAVAAAVFFVVAVVAYRDFQRGREIPTYRAQEPTAVRSLLTEGAALARGRFVLRWSTGPEGASYRLRVMDEDLEPLVDLPLPIDRPEFVVPSDALARVPPGRKILWQVVVIEPGGREAASETFTNRVGE
jgi:hypothetical protein